MVIVRHGDAVDTSLQEFVGQDIAAREFVRQRLGALARD